MAAAEEQNQAFSLGEQAQGQDAMGGFEEALARPPSRQQQQRPESRADGRHLTIRKMKAAVDALPVGDMDEEEYVSMLNRVLRIVGLHAQVSRFDECAQASVFVAIFERLFQVRLSNVIRNLETYEDRVLNCQRVIDALGA